MAPRYPYQNVPYKKVPFRELNKKEQARRIAVGEESGRMTAAQAAKARRFWGVPKPLPVTKAATIYAGEKLGRPWEIPPVPKGKQKQQRYEPGVTKPSKPPPKPDRYDLARQAAVSDLARRQLLESASPQRQQQLREDLRPVPPSPPKRAWWDAARRYDPVTHALSFGESAAIAAEMAGGAAGRGLLGVGQAFSGTFSGVPSRSSITESGVSRGPQAAGISPEVVPILAGGAAKAVVGGGGAIAAFRHPIRATVESGGELLDMGRGIGQAAALPIILSDPDMSRKDKQALFHGLAVAAIEDLNRRVGPDTSVAEAFEIGKDEPLISALNAAAVIAPTLKTAIGLNAMVRGGATIGETLRLLRRTPVAALKGRKGMTFREARELVRNPAAARTLRLAVEGGVETKHLEVPWSRSPLIRATVNRPHDVVSRLTQATPGLRRLPIAERKRAVRALNRQNRRMQRRLPAEARALFNDVAEAAGKATSLTNRPNDPTRMALALLLQKPKGFTDDEWLQAIATDLRQMLESGKFVTPGERVSPGVQRLLNRARNYERKTQDARSRRRAKASKNIAQEQGRLADALGTISDRGNDLLEERARIQGDESLSVEERSQQLTEIEVELHVLERQATVMREELDDLTVDQDPVESPERTNLEQSLRAHRNFQGDNAGRVDDVLRVTDTRARVWGRQTGQEPGEWYRDLETRAVSPHEIPRAANVLFQRRDWTPEELAAQRARYGDLDPERDLTDLLDEQETIGFGAKGSGHPDQVRSRGDLGGLMRDLARRLGEGLPYARDWYSDSGHSILEYAGGDTKRADTIAALFAIYSPQKPVAENLAMAFRVYEDHRLGKPPAHGTVTQKKLAAEALAGRDWLKLVGPEQQPKVRRFYANILKHVDPDLMRAKGFNGREVTADGWMGAAYGYMHNTGGKALSAAQIRFIERSTQALADHFGLEPEQAQAAIWASIKAERDKTTASRYGDPETREAVLSTAGESFSDSLFRPQYTLRMPLEGMSASKAEWQAGMSTAERSAYTRELGHAYVEELRQQGFVARLTDGGFGFYLAPDGDVEINPAIAIEVATGDIPATRNFGKLDKHGRPLFEPTPSRYYRVRPDQKKFYDGLAATVAQAAEQEAAAWGRRIVSRKMSDATSWRIRIGRGLTEEEMGKLARALDDDRFHSTQHSDGVSIVLNNPDRVLGRATKIDRDRRAGVDTAEIKRKHEAEFKRNRAHVDEVVTAAFEETPGNIVPQVDHHSHRGSYLASDTYRASIGDSGRPDVLGRLGDLLSERTAAVDARYRHDPARAASDAAERTAGRAGGVTRNQVREGDLLGAMQFVDSPAGKRILYLTERSDASTVLHELVGHATDEMKRFYPDEFRAVEEEIGMPYADWGVEEHETFARWAERYFLEGRAPTPELAPAMERIKSWMRVIYAGMTRALGGRMPVATRVLFDSYFGAYDDVNVARIAMEMNGKGDERLTMERYGGAEVITRGELQALKKRIETQRYGRSLDGMTNRLEELRDKGPSNWTDAEHEEHTQLSAQSLRRAAHDESRKSTREQNLRKKLSDLEKALERGTDNRRFQGALQAMRWISEDRERILKDIFGDQYDEIFSNRTDLLADWLVERGLLKPEFERGTAAYFPATMDAAVQQALKQPARAISGGLTVGKTRRDLLTLEKRNNMILWQNGDWTADPAVLMEAHMRALGYAWMNEVKTQLWDIGRSLTDEEAKNLPRDVYIINPHGTPLGPGLKAQMRSNSTTNDVQHLYSGMDGGDNVALEASMKNYVAAFMIDTNKLPEGFNASENEGLRVVPKDIVEGILRPVPGGVGGRKWDAVTTLSRWGLIYSNVPGYMLANVIGNSGFLVAQGGFRMVDAVWAARKLMLNPKLRALIEPEVGETPYQAAISRTRNWDQTTKNLEDKALRGIGIVDRWPRLVSWVYEARKAGYTTEDDMFRLVRGADEKTRRDRERVAQFTNEHMVNFDRLSDFERVSVTRALFVWPWVRGATAWPFWYAKNYPERTAIAANVGLTLEERRKKMLGPTPPWYEGLVPVSVEGNRARVIQGNPISPTSTALQSAELVRDTFKSLVLGVDDPNAQHLIGLFQPAFQEGISAATGRDDFGRDRPLRDVLGELPITVLPPWRIWKAITDPTTVPSIYTEAGLKQRTARTFIRISPLEISIPRLNAQAAVTGEKGATEKIEAAVARERGAFHRAAPGATFPEQMIRKGITMKVVFAEQRKQLEQEKRKNRQFTPRRLPSGAYSKPSLTEYEQMHLAYSIVQRYLPEYGGYLKPEETFASFNNPAPNSRAAQVLARAWMNKVWSKLTSSATKASNAEERLKDARAIQRAVDSAR